MNKSAVRRAITTLANQGVITPFKITLLEGVNEGMVQISFILNADLIQPKKRVYIRKNKTK